jgi:hypothetical protein
MQMALTSQAGDALIARTGAPRGSFIRPNPNGNTLARGSTSKARIINAMNKTKAIQQAKKAHRKTGDHYFVFRDDDRRGGHDYCSEREYYHGSCQWVKPEEVIYHTGDGYY